MPAPTAALLGDWGTNAVVSVLAGSDDTHGWFQVVTTTDGTFSPSAEVYLVYGTAKAGPPVCLVQITSKTGCGQPFFVTSKANEMLVYMLNAPTPNTVYTFAYLSML